MAVGRRPKRSNPKAQRMIFVCELEHCPHCGTRLTSEGCGGHSSKTVQTLNGEWCVVAYSRLCPNADCRAFEQHFHAAGHLRVSPPYSTYGMDVIAWVGMLREREHKQFVEIQSLLNQQGVVINDWSVGRLYRLFLALLEGTWPQSQKHLARAVQEHGGLILALIGDLPVLALLSDQEKALGTALRTVWPSAAHQLCQMHFLQNLSAPLHRADQQLRQALQEQLSPLAPVPDPEGEESEPHVAHREPAPEAEGKKEEVGEATPRPAAQQNPKREPRFGQLLFPQSQTESELGDTASRKCYYSYYRQAIHNALRRSSLKPLQCGGLRGHDQLMGIGQHLQQQRIQRGPDTYLDSLHERVHTALQEVAAQAQGVRQAHTFLTQVEHYLAHAPRPSVLTGDVVQRPSVPDSQMVRQELTRMFSELAQQEPIHPTVRRVLRKWEQMSKTWLPGTLHCYDIPGLPRSNLNLEAAFGHLRRAQRRTSGRKETTPLRIFGPGQIMLLTLDEEQVLPRLQSVPVDVYWLQRRRQAEREEPRRWLRRLHRDPLQALQQLDEQFYAVANAPSGPSSSTPDG